MEGLRPTSGDHCGGADTKVRGPQWSGRDQGKGHSGGAETNIRRPLWRGQDQGEKSRKTAGQRLSRRKHLKSDLWRSQSESRMPPEPCWEIRHPACDNDALGASQALDRDQMDQ